MQELKTQPCSSCCGQKKKTSKTKLEKTHIVLNHCQPLQKHLSSLQKKISNFEAKDLIEDWEKKMLITVDQVRPFRLIMLSPADNNNLNLKIAPMARFATLDTYQILKIIGGVQDFGGTNKGAKVWQNLNFIPTPKRFSGW
jgi:hypothetical protein